MSTFPGFCDLCVNSNTETQKLHGILSRLHSLGYETVAINQTIDESIFDNEKKKKKKEAKDETVASSLPIILNLTDLKREFAKKLCLLSRITFVFGDTSKVHTLAQSNILKNYDIYGVVPKTQAALQFACSQSGADVVTIKSAYHGLKLNRKLYLQAAERGIHFEIQYTDIINQATRKYALHYSHLFHIFGKSKNVVISSGATEEYSLRNPYDVINLASLLGLDETKAKASVLGQCKHLLSRAEGRRYGKAVFAIRTNVDDLPTSDKSEKSRSVKRRKI